MSDPPRLRDEAVVMLHEVLNLDVRGHSMPSTIVACATSSLSPVTIFSTTPSRRSARSVSATPSMGGSKKSRSRITSSSAIRRLSTSYASR
jgi:hypothetical protein